MVIRVHFMISTLVLGLPLLFGVQDDRVPVGADDDLELPGDPEHPVALRAAFFDVLEAHADLYGRGLLQPDGQPASLEVAKREQAFLTEQISTRLFLTADAERKEVWSLGRMLEAYLANRGVLAAANARSADPELKPADLLSFAEAAWLEGPCPWPHGLSVQQTTPQAEHSDLPQLGQASARYLLFGFVTDPFFWRTRPAGAKQAFLHELFARAELDSRAAEMVSFAIQPPMRLRPPLSAAERTIAGPFKDLGEPIGFTVEHLAQLRELESALAESRRSGGRSGESPPRLDGDDEALAGEQPVRALRPGLAAWVSKTKAQVLDELFGPGAGSRVLRDGTLADRKAFWDQAARSWPYAQLRSEVLSDLRELVEWRDTSEHEARIRELSSLRKAGLLDAEDQQELLGLERQLDLERRQFVGHVMGLLGGAGESTDGRLAFETLRTDVPEVLGDLHSVSVRQFLSHGWLAFSARPNPEAPRLLQALADGGDPVPDQAFDALLIQLGRENHPDQDLLLDRLASTGSNHQRLASVRAAAGRMPTQRATAVWREVLGLAPGRIAERQREAGQDPARHGVDPADRDGVLSVLGKWPDRQGASDFLVELIESEVFAGTGPGSLAQHSTAGRRRLAGLLSDGQRLRLTQAGRWPAALDTVP